MICCDLSGVITWQIMECDVALLIMRLICGWLKVLDGCAPFVLDNLSSLMELLSSLFSKIP